MNSPKTPTPLKLFLQSSLRLWKLMMMERKRSWKHKCRLLTRRSWWETLTAPEPRFSLISTATIWHRFWRFTARKQRWPSTSKAWMSCLLQYIFLKKLQQRLKAENQTYAKFLTAFLSWFQNFCLLRSRMMSSFRCSASLQFSKFCSNITNLGLLFTSPVTHLAVSCMPWAGSWPTLLSKLL